MRVGVIRKLPWRNPRNTPSAVRDELTVAVSRTAERRGTGAAAQAGPRLLPLGCSRPRHPESGSGSVESATSAGGDDVDVRSTWRHGLRSTFARIDRVLERRRAVALARHYREAEGLSIAQIAGRLGRSPATVKAYFYDPTGEKARAVKARYVGVCRGCGAYTQPRNGKGDAYAYCKALPPWRERAPLDPPPRARCDARMARPLRTAAVVVRLVAHTRASTRQRAARAPRAQATGPPPAR